MGAEGYAGDDRAPPHRGPSPGTLFGNAEVYGPFTNEELVGPARRGRTIFAAEVEGDLRVVCYVDRELAITIDIRFARLLPRLAIRLIVRIRDLSVGLSDCHPVCA